MSWSTADDTARYIAVGRCLRLSKQEGRMMGRISRVVSWPMLSQSAEPHEPIVQSNRSGSGRFCVRWNHPFRYSECPQA